MCLSEVANNFHMLLVFTESTGTAKTTIFVEYG